MTGWQLATVCVVAIIATLTWLGCTWWLWGGEQ